MYKAINTKFNNIRVYTGHYSAGIVSQYSVVHQPDDLPAAAGGESVPVYSQVEDGQEYDYATQPPLDGNSCPAEYEVVMDTNSGEKTSTYYSVPSKPVIVANPSYEKNYEIIQDTDHDEQ